MVVSVEHKYEVGRAGGQPGIYFRSQQEFDVLQAKRAAAPARAIQEVLLYVFGNDTPARPDGRA